MPFLVIHKSSHEVVATINRDDLASWLGLVEIPTDRASEYRTLPIPVMLTLPNCRTSVATALADRATPLPHNRDGRRQHIETQEGPQAQSPAVS